MKKKAKALMMLGTASSVGKTVLTAGLCRLFTQEGLTVRPFKSQNMSSSSLVMDNGCEMSFAQAMQAEACKTEPRPEMNPILLKPRSQCGSEVWVRGKLLDTLSAKDYYAQKKSLWPQVKEAFDLLAEEADLVMVEGAGSPAEINLQQDDFVNLGLAERLDIPCLLIGDIDRGGVFASLYGTLALSDENKRRLIKGLIINKFRGDMALLEPGLRQMEELCGKEIIGTVPMFDLDLDEEDSLSARESGRRLEDHMSREKRDQAYDRLAEHLRRHLDMAKLRQIIEQGSAC